LVVLSTTTLTVAMIVWFRLSDSVTRIEKACGPSAKLRARTRSGSRAASRAARVGREDFEDVDARQVHLRGVDDDVVDEQVDVAQCLHVENEPADAHDAGDGLAVPRGIDRSERLALAPRAKRQVTAATSARILSAFLSMRIPPRKFKMRMRNIA
jgi:hypothetical protein